MKYVTEIELGAVPLDSVRHVVEAVRAYGFPDLDLANARLRAEFLVGPGGVVEDLWDLHAVVEEIEVVAEGYGARVPVPKPVPVEEPS